MSVNRFPRLKFEGRLLVVGGGRCVWDDFDKLGRKWDGDVLCINDIAMHFPLDVKHIYSNDHKMIHKWAEARRPKLNKIEYLHSNNINWPFRENNSAVNAVLCGVAMYEKVVVIGCPLDNSGHYFDPPWVGSSFPPQRLDYLEPLLKGVTWYGRNDSLPRN